MTEQAKRRVASVSFNGSTPRERKAQTIFNEWRKKPDPDDPENETKHMRAQDILIEALLALEERNIEPEITSQDGMIINEISDLRGQIAAGLFHISKSLEDVEARIQQLAIDGKITEDQAHEVKDAIGAKSITKEFARNIGAAYKPGRRNNR